MQLDLFEHSQIAPDQLLVKFLELKNSQDLVRRAIFQRFQDLKNLVTDLQVQIEEMKQEKTHVEAS